MSDASGSPAKVEEKSADLPNKAPVVKKPATKTTHPNTAEMVKAAIKTLNERGGSSLRAIKKYIGATYQVDTDKLAPYIKKFVKSAVIDGILVQTKGTGAGGSFKLPVKKASKAKATAKKPTAKQTSDEAKSPVKKAASAASKEVTVEKSVSPKKATTKSKAAAFKKATVEKAASPKKAAKSPIKPKAAASKKATVEKTVSPKKAAKSPTMSKAAASSKAKKTVKSPTAKPKSPKPKKIAAPKTTKASVKKIATAH